MAVAMEAAVRVEAREAVKGAAWAEVMVAAKAVEMVTAVARAGVATVEEETVAETAVAVTAEGARAEARVVAEMVEAVRVVVMVEEKE